MTIWKPAFDILNQPHVLIAGETGCGKSTLLHHILNAAMTRPETAGTFCLIDLKAGVELCDYEDDPHVTSFCDSTESALAALDAEVEQMTRILQTMRRAKLKKWDGVQRYIVIDELAFLLQNAKKPALKALTAISQQGRAAGYHLIVATQDPSREGLPAVVQKNLPCRIGLHCISAMDSRQAVGVSGCELLPRWGSAIMRADGTITRISIPPLDD